VNLAATNFGSQGKRSPQNPRLAFRKGKTKEKSDIWPRKTKHEANSFLPIYSGAADTPFAGGAVSIKNGRLGFFGDDGAGVFVDVDESSQVSNSVRITIDGEEDSESYVSLAGDDKDGLRGVVVSDSPSKGALFRFGEIDDDGYAKITREGGGRWVVESVRDDDYELLWWDGK
jgi:hypothetical protein